MKSFRFKIFFILFLFVFCVMSMSIRGCGGDEADVDEDKGFYCPSCNGVASWYSYEWAFFDVFGRDSFGWKLVSDCGWQVYEGHEGGYGDTLELVSCNGGVVLIWAWNDLSGFVLREGWSGTTVEGIKLGDSLEDFLVVYPNFVQEGDRCYKFEFDDGGGIYEDGFVIAQFDEEEKLEEIYVYRPYLQNDNNVTPYDEMGCFVSILNNGFHYLKIKEGRR